MSRRLPRVLIDVSREDGAPREPSDAVLRAACIAALEEIPEQRNTGAFARARLSVDVRLVNDAAITELNLKHMKHEGPTDVLSFPMNEDDPSRRSFHVGDVVVSFETAQREAAARRLSVSEEIARYCVHGFLHCMGYDDSTPSKRRAMFALQELALCNAGVSPARMEQKYKRAGGMPALQETKSAARSRA